jgi:hypothetical protein
MFAAMNISSLYYVFIVGLVIALGIAGLLSLFGAVLGARGTAASGRRGQAIGCGFGLGMVVTLAAGAGWLLGLTGGALALSAPLIGGGISFAVARGVVSEQ